MNTPDITPAQIGGYITAGLGLLATFGLKLSEAHSIEVLSLTGAMAAVLMYADKEIRKGRAMAAAANSGGYSFKTAVKDDLLSEPLPAPAAVTMGAAPTVDAPPPVVEGSAVPAPEVDPPPAPATIGQPAA